MRIDARTTVTKGLRHPRLLSLGPREISCVCACSDTFVCVQESTLYNYIRGRNLSPVARASWLIVKLRPHRYLFVNGVESRW